MTKIKGALIAAGLALLAVGPQTKSAYADCLDVSVPCSGDFSDGGEFEDHNRLLGNASSFSLGFIQNNKVRIQISTQGRVGIGVAVSTPLATLHIVGDVRITSAAKFLDYISGSSATLAGTVTSTSGFIGDGSRLTGISGTGIGAGSTFYIQNSSTPQQPSAFYVTSGTVNRWSMFDSTAVGAVVKVDQIFFSSAFGRSPLYIYNIGELRFNDGLILLSSAVLMISSNALSTENLIFRINQVAIDTGTNKIAINALNTATAAIRSDLNISTSAMTLQPSNTNYFDTGSSTQTKFGGLNVAGALVAQGSFTALTGNINLNTIEYVFPSSGPQLGQILRNDGGSKLLWTLDSAGGAGTGQVISSTVGIKPFQLVVGTLGAQNVDIASSTVDGLNEAILRLGASGLTNSTTAGGLIYFKRGGYSIQGATIPAGVTVFAAPESSVSWSMGNVSDFFVTIHGIVDGINFTGSPTPFNNGVVFISTGGRLRNFKISDFNFQNTDLRKCLVCVDNSTNVVISDGFITRFSGDEIDGNVMNSTSASAPISIVRSTDVYLNRVDTGHYGEPTTSVSPAIVIWQSARVFVENSRWERMTPAFLKIQNSQDSQILNNRGHIVSPDVASDFGVLELVENSTGIVIRNNFFDIRGPDSAKSVIATRNLTSSGRNNGSMILQNIVRGNPAGSQSWTFINLNSSALGTTANTTIRDNDAYSSFTSFLVEEATSIGTKFTSLGNMFNGVEQ